MEGQAGERRRVETREERQRRKMERGPPEEREGSLIFSAIDGLHRPTSQQDGVARPLRKCLSCAKVFGAYDLFGYDGHVCGVRGAAAHPKPPTYDGIPPAAAATAVPPPSCTAIAVPPPPCTATAVPPPAAPPPSATTSGSSMHSSEGLHVAAPTPVVSMETIVIDGLNVTKHGHTHTMHYPLAAHLRSVHCGLCAPRVWRRWRTTGASVTRPRATHARSSRRLNTSLRGACRRSPHRIE